MMGAVTVVVHCLGSVMLYGRASVRRAGVWAEESGVLVTVVTSPESKRVKGWKTETEGYDE